jgi:ribonuclease G
MQAAFINIGLDRTAFLYVGDVLDPESLKVARDNAPPDALTPEIIKDRSSLERRPIEKIIKEGQRIIVQIAKEPLGTKGARVTMFLSIPGRYLVLMPDFNHIGVSRRIEEEEERQRLTSLVENIKSPDSGIIIRTAAKNVDEDLLIKDLEYLKILGQEVAEKSKIGKIKELIHSDLGIIEKTVRDVYSESVSQIILDDETSFDKLNTFLKSNIPGSDSKLQIYSEITPLFDVYGIEMDIGRALGARVELPSGGYLIIDQAEALTSFDVNTGRFVGQLSAQETILKTNMESAIQVVAQLRIRNIGGIIVIDFIDMENLEDRETVYEALQEELKKDKARTNVLKISELGLVQMTRKRTSESLERQLMEPCFYCDGRGRIRSTESEAYDLLREITRRAIQSGDKKITVRVREDIREFIESKEADLFDAIKRKHKIRVAFQQSKLTLDMLNDPPSEVLFS